MGKEKKTNVECAECEKPTQVELTIGEDGYAAGQCGECGLDMGAVYNRDRIERAQERLRSKRNASKKETETEKKTKNTINPFGKV